MKRSIIDRTTFQLLILSIISIIAATCTTCSSFSGKEKPCILLVSGGHNFDTIDFYNVFFELPGYNIDTISQPGANKLISSEKDWMYDAIIFYDMWPEISEDEKKAYIRLTELGVPLLFLHHSIVSYQQWPEYKKITGGRYYTMINGVDSSVLSSYKHGIDIDVEVVDPGHPVLKGIKNFRIHDEGYSNLSYTGNIHPLLRTGHPDCSEIIGWTNSYNNSDIVYLLFGHDKMAYANNNFSLLIENSLQWLCREN